MLTHGTSDKRMGSGCRAFVVHAPRQGKTIDLLAPHRRPCKSNGGTGIDIKLKRAVSLLHVV